MARKQNKYYIILSALFFLGCATRTNYQIKSFFFDGVPNPMENTSATLIDSLKLNPNPNDSIVLVNSNNIFILKGSIHAPYFEKKCFDCHDPNKRGKTNLSINQLCFSCHENFEAKYKYQHGPVASGNCTQCHNPHKSEFESLLLSNGQDLCYQCHSEKNISENNFHDSIEDQNCINCHNPHGGENFIFLQKKSCTQCHENFNNNQYVHGPVAAGECGACHQTHSSKSKKNILPLGNSLCFNCHNSNDIYKGNYHQKIKKQNCITCHNPHSSNEKYLLTKTIQ